MKLLFGGIDKPEINLRYGQTIVTNLNLLVIENDRLTLDCQIQSNPSTIEPITWLKNGASMTGINSPSLTLQTIKRTDEGEYTCVTSNSIGRSQASVNIRVQCKINIISSITKKKKLFFCL
jgi:hypothetical protein